MLCGLYVRRRSAFTRIQPAYGIRLLVTGNSGGRNVWKPVIVTRRSNDCPHGKASIPGAATYLYGTTPHYPPPLLSSCVPIQPFYGVLSSPMQSIPAERP